MIMNNAIFREYDIRGVVGADYDDDFANILGKAFGTHAKKYNAGLVTLGRDCRLSSDSLRDALLEGMLSTGLKVLDVGVVPTPVFYYSVIHAGAQGGLMITGSHNPSDYNGFKVHLGGTTIYGKEIQQIKHIIDAGNFAEGKGSVEDLDIVAPYKKYLLDNFKFKSKLRVAIDAGNGTGGPIAEDVFKKLGLDVTPLYCDMDGNFPNHHPDPTVEEYLQDLIKAVKDGNLDVGIGFDGDADRIGTIDENGDIVWGDRLQVIYARDVLEEVPGATIVSEVKCSQTLFDDIKARGGKPIMWKAGHSLIKAKMREVKAALGGEMSGHIFFAHKFFGHDDAIYAALKLIEIMDKNGKTVSELLEGLPKTFTTPEIRVDCPDDIKFDVVRRVTEKLRSKHEIIDIDGVRVLLDGGWGLVRSSNTQPVLVLRFEADTEARLAEIKEYIEGVVEETRQEG